MIAGFIIDRATADTIAAGVEQAQTARGQSPYIAARAVPIHSGAHAGAMFLPLSDGALTTPLRRGLTMRDFPEFDQLLAMLGGLDARVEIDPADLIDPNAPTV